MKFTGSGGHAAVFSLGRRSGHGVLFLRLRGDESGTKHNAIVSDG